MILEKWDAEAKQVIAAMSRNEKARLDAIIAMHILVTNMNDEAAYGTWIYLVPDGATEWDFIDFALNDKNTTSNHLFDEAVALFKRLWSRYGADDKGLYIGEQTY